MERNRCNLTLFFGGGATFCLKNCLFCMYKSKCVVSGLFSVYRTVILHSTDSV